MAKRMLIDATHKEETRVSVIDGNKLAEYDYESQSRKPIKGSIFLAKVTRVEPSLQAAFVNFGGNRHGFLPFSEIHPDYFRIPVSDKEALMAEQEALLKEHDEEEAAEEAELDDEVEGAEEGEHDGEGDEVPDVDAEDLDSDDVEAASEGDAPDGQAENVEDGDDKKRGRDKGRGRGRGRGRAQYRNKSVEVVGGSDYDAEQRFRFNLRRKYKIQEVIKRGQIMLVQANKEERGNKGAAVGTYLSLPGRYCVLMPNSPRAGGVSRKIANGKDRARMREIVKELEVPKGMSVIVRTAGVARTKSEIKRDLDYLMRLWNNIRELTLESTAPAVVYEEADLIKRSVRDLYTRDIEEIIVSGEEGYKTAKDFMKMLIPSHVKKVKRYEDDKLPLFHRYQIESQIDEIGLTEVRLKSGGYLVINPTEALVSIDVNSGKSTKGRHIEETALKTNLEAADEVARQLKLRDLGGLVVIDFIDMEDRRSNGKVERRMRDALSDDRARVQVGRISSFGLMELSRQRLSPSLTEAQYETCKVCSGIGVVRTADAMSILVMRAIEEEGIKGRAAQIIVQVNSDVALYILNHKRKKLAEAEERYNFQVLLRVDDELPVSDYLIEVSRPAEADDGSSSAGDESGSSAPSHTQKSADEDTHGDEDGSENKSKRSRGRRGGRNRNNRRRQDDQQQEDGQGKPDDVSAGDEQQKKAEPTAAKKDEEGEKKADKPARKRTSRKKKEDSSPEASDVSGPANDVEQPKQEEKASEEASKPKRTRKKAEVKSDTVTDIKVAAKSEKKQAEPEPSKDYEVVNEEPKEKKKGWWNLGPK